MAENIGPLMWVQKMTAMHDAMHDTFIPRFKEIVAIAPPGDQEMARSMVEHESALWEMTRREIGGMTDRSANRSWPLPKFPLPRPRTR
jgi:hypothetical protein